jgi:peptide-methionine (S)-S-oxide reductase
MLIKPQSFYLICNVGTLLNVKIGFGGGCHWCAEAVFLALKGVKKVDQGWIASEGENVSLSEAVIVHFNPEDIPLKILIEVHLKTHKSSSNYGMRSKYRSTIYYFQDSEEQIIKHNLDSLKSEFYKDNITKVLPLNNLRSRMRRFRITISRVPKNHFLKLI